MPIEREQQLFMRSPAVVSRRIAGETLVVPVRGKVGDLASIYSFNGTGSLIWELLASPSGLMDLVCAVEQEYGITQERAQADVKQFLNDMLAAGLVEVGGAAAEEEMPAIDMTATAPQMREELQAGR